ncbi:MAG: efflux RND transporter periplasmic adaptor subunit [Candidatus Rifleibacteriota bacterium]
MNNATNSKIKPITLMVGAFLVGIFAGYFLFAGDNSNMAGIHGHKTEKQSQIWTCSMHPQIKKDKPGKCPICFMDLIPLGTDTGSANPDILQLSEAAKVLAEVKTAPIYIGPATRTLRLPGTVQLDETRVKHVTAWVGGRIERLYVNYAGIPVKTGDHMAEFYSPDLIAAQEELIRSAGNETLHRAVLERLLRWGISADQIRTFESAKSPSKLVTINSPSEGIVIDLNVREGMYVNQGTRLFSVADLSKLWLVASVYERDIQWLRYGQKVECEFEAYPGKIFPGTISFISPVLSGASRTVDARINVDNSRGLLKPGMFGRITIKVSIGENGEIINPELAGKWISPMHPEIVKDGPGNCDICGMALVPIESLGVNTSHANTSPMIIPESAVLWTGTRSIAFREIDPEKRTYEAAEIKVGPKVDNGYLVYSGLSANDKVVVEGAFKLDSEQQIKGHLSMMNPHRQISEESISSGKTAKLSSDEIQAIEKQIKLCLEIAEKLAKDDLASANSSAMAAHNQLADLEKSENVQIKNIAKKLMMPLMALMSSKDLKSAREQLFNLTPALKELVEISEKQLSFQVYENFCPMAFDNKGATWLQKSPELANPFFGKMMLRCGETKKVWNEGK